MKKNLFTIDESEKQRILEMHLNATQKLYLNEQGEVSSTGSTVSQSSSTIGGVQISGFLFAEDDKEWLIAKNNELKGKVSGQVLNDENYGRVLKYYGTQPTSVDPNNLIGKYVIMFNKIPKQGIYSYQKENVVNTTFKIGLIYKNKTNKMIFITTGGSSSIGLNVRVPLLSTTVNVDFAFFLYNSNDNLTDRNNPHINGVFGYIKPDQLKTFKELQGDQSKN